VLLALLLAQWTLLKALLLLLLAQWTLLKALPLLLATLPRKLLTQLRSKHSLLSKETTFGWFFYACAQVKAQSNRIPCGHWQS
jgi:hypothetical protein